MMRRVRLGFLLSLLCLALVTACSDEGASTPETDALTDAVSDTGTDTATATDATDPTDAAADPFAGLITADEALELVDVFIGSGASGFQYASLTPAVQEPAGFVKLGPDTTNKGAHSTTAHHFSGYWFNDPQLRGFSHTHFVGTGAVDYGNLRVTPLSGFDGGTVAGKGAARWWLDFDKDTEAGRPGEYTVQLDDPPVDVALTARSWAGLHRYTARQTQTLWLAVDPTASIEEYDPGEGATEAKTTVITSAEDQGGRGHVTGYVVYDGGYVGRSLPFTLYFDIVASRPIADTATWQGEGEDATWEQPGAGAGDRAYTADVEGARSGVSLGFALQAGEDVELRVGVSLIDAAMAEKHRVAQLGEGEGALPFDDVVAANRAAWRDKLGRVRVRGGTDAVREIFYTALYNIYRMPTRFDELDHDLDPTVPGVGGRYRGLDGAVHETDEAFAGMGKAASEGGGFRYHSDISMWDTYRSYHSWLALADPRHQYDILQSLLAMGRDGGWIPKWPAALSYTGGMIASPADIAFGDSAARGLFLSGDWQVDYAAALDNLAKTANDEVPAGAPYGGRETGITEYLALGWVPAEVSSGNVSQTLEYAWCDEGLANLAAAIGDPREATFRARAGSWANQWNADVGFHAPRLADGSFQGGFDPIVYEGQKAFTEASAWHYRFYPPYDADGLASLFGGKDGLGDALEAFFANSALANDLIDTDGDDEPNPTMWILPDPYYWHGNEPPLHAVAMFEAADRPDRLGHWLRLIQTRNYGTGPDGLSGNDDGGTLSAWYLSAAVGLFAIPGTPDAVLVPPLFEQVVIAREDEDGQPRTPLVIEAPGFGVPTTTFTAATLVDANGQETTLGSRVRHVDLMAAETLRFE